MANCVFFCLLLLFVVQFELGIDGIVDLLAQSSMLGEASRNIVMVDEFWTDWLLLVIAGCEI